MKWYKRDPNAALTGMAGMTLEERGAYNAILDLIYARDGNVPDDERFMRINLGCDIRTWKRLRARLIELGKITIEGGLIANFRATSELKFARSRMKVEADRREKARQIKETTPENHRILTTTTTTREERKKEDAPAKRRSLHPLADDWKPVGELTHAQTAELEKMRDWAKSNAARKADWEATFRNWLRRAGVPPVETSRVVPIKGFFVLDDSPERAAWEAWGIKNGKAFPRGMKSGGWAFPSQWPPGYEHADHLGRETETTSNSERAVEAGALGEYLRSAVQSNVLRIGSKGRVGA